MGVKFPTYITEFDNGMTTKPRDQTPGIARSIKHFDNYSDPDRLVPHRSLKADTLIGFEDTLDAFRITKILNTPIGIFGFGQLSASDAHACVYTKVSKTDPTTLWTAANSGSDASNGGARNDSLFLYYHNYLYGANATGIWKYGDITGSPAFTYNEYTTHVPTGQGLVHSKSDIMYVPSANLVLRNNNGVWDVGLQLPVGASIKSMCEDGNYLAVGFDMPDGKTITYLWDQDSSVETITDKIDWGTGSTQLLENCGGIMVDIVSTVGVGTSLDPKLQFKYYTGSEVKIFQEWSCTSIIIKDKQVFNNIVYFLAEITLNNGETLRGVWKIFKKANGNLTVSFDTLPRNDVVLGAASLQGFYRDGDYMFVTYINPANALFTIWRTDDQANFLATSIFETPKFNQILGLRNKHIPDSSMVKKLIGVTLNFESLTAGQTAGVQYRIEGETNWTPIFAHGTVGDITHSAINTEVVAPAVTANLREHREIEFQLFSTNGAIITGFSFEVEVIGKRVY